MKSTITVSRQSWILLGNAQSAESRGGDSARTELIGTTGVYVFSRFNNPAKLVNQLTEESNALLKSVFKEGDKFKFDNTFIEGVDNLVGEADLGWYTGETAYFSVSAILKDNKIKGSVFKTLTERIEAIAKSAGLTDIRIDFQLVVNPRLKTDPTWAREFGYHFSVTEETVGTVTSTVVTWEKTIK